MRRPIQKTEECYMAKKVISFIVILLVFCTAGAAVLIGTSNFGLGFGGMTENPVSSAYAAGPRGRYLLREPYKHRNGACVRGFHRKAAV